MVSSLLVPASGFNADTEYIALRTFFWIDGGCIVSATEKKLVQVGRRNPQDEKVDK